MSRDMEKFTFGFLFGGLVGVLIGLLIAPDSGARTRHRIVNGAVKASDAALTVVDRAEEVAGRLTGRVGHYFGDEDELAWRRVREIRQELEGRTSSAR